MSRIYIFSLDTVNYSDIEKIVKEFSVDSEVEFSEPVFYRIPPDIRKISKENPGIFC